MSPLQSTITHQDFLIWVLGIALTLLESQELPQLSHVCPLSVSVLLMFAIFFTLLWLCDTKSHFVSQADLELKRSFCLCFLNLGAKVVSPALPSLSYSAQSLDILPMCLLVHSL